MLSALYAIARPFVRPFVTRVDQPTRSKLLLGYPTVLRLMPHSTLCYAEPGSQWQDWHRDTII